MTLRWDDIRLFLAVYEQGSLSGAARILRLGQPTLSRRIGELENDVGEALFVRGSNGVELTSAGLKLLPAAQSMAEWANEADSSIARQTDFPEGKVRIAAPPGISSEVVVPWTAKIRQQYPQIQIELLSSTEIMNLGRGEADISLRTIRPTDSDLVCLDEISTTMRVYASKSYAAQFSLQPNIESLDWIGWEEDESGHNRNSKLRALIPSFKLAFTSDDYIVQMAACKEGVGVMLLPQGLHRNTSLRELIELEIELGTTIAANLYLVCHKRHRHLPKIQLIIDFISKEFDAWRRA